MKINIQHESLLKFLRHPTQKVLAILGKLNPEFNLPLQLDLLNRVIIDFSDVTDIEAVLNHVPSSQSSIFIFNLSSDRHVLENMYVRYQLDRWQAKVIIICDSLFLHPSLDSSIYFAPIKNNRIQKHLLATILLPSLDKALYSNTRKNYSSQFSNQRDEPNYTPEINKHFLNKKLMAYDTSIMQMLGEKAQTDNAFAAFLFSLVFASRNNMDMQVAAANAITALNYGRINFSNMDLSSIKIPFADLSGAILHHTNLSSADLTNVILKNAFIANINFSNCNLENVEFGEYYKIKNNNEPYYNSDVAIYHDSFITTSVHQSETSHEKITVFDINTNKRLLEINVGYVEVNQISMSEDGNYMAVEGYHKNKETLITILYRLADGKKLKVWRDGIFILAFAPSQKLIAYRNCTSDDLYIAAIDSTKQSPSLNSSGFGITGFGGRFTNVCFDQSGSYFALSNYDCTRIWQTETYHLLTRLRPSHTINSPFLLSNELDPEFDGIDYKGTLCFKPNSSILVTANPADILIWDFIAQRFLGHMQGHTAYIYAMAFNKDGSILATGSDDNTICLWDTMNWCKLNVIAHQANRITKLLFHSTNSLIAYICPDEISFVDIRAKNPSLFHKGHVHVIESLAINQKKTLFATCSYDGTICLWRVDDAVLVKIISHSFKSKPNRIAFTSNDEQLLIAIDDRLLLIEEKLSPLYCYNFINDTISEKLIPKGKVKFSQDNNLLAIYDDKRIIIWDRQNNKEITNTNGYFADSEEALAEIKIGRIERWLLSLDNKYLILGYDSGRVCKVDIANFNYTWINIHQRDKASENNAIVVLTYDQYKRLIIANDIGTISICNEYIITVDTQIEGIRKICAITPDIIIIAHDEYLSLWNISKKQQLFLVKAHLASINEIAFFAGDIIVTVSSDHALSYWRYTQQDGDNKLLLFYTTLPLFNAYQCNIAKVKNLNYSSAKLLNQFGALNSPNKNNTENNIYKSTNNGPSSYKPLLKIS